MAVNDTSSSSSNRKLVQTKLTAAFFSPNRSSTTDSRSPYFTRPAAVEEPLTPDGSEALDSQATESQASHSTTTSVDLHPARRAHLQHSTSTASESQQDPGPSSKSSASLASIAAETINVLPSILASLPYAPATGILYSSQNMHALHAHRCPQLSASPIRVLNADTLDTALNFPASAIDRKPVLVLNMANAYHPGGGWRSGALAQEESMCYRSSLSFSLKRRFYPMAPTDAIYSPTVIVMRESLDRGHGFLDLTRPSTLGLVSVVSVAAVRDPQLARDRNGEMGYRWSEDEEGMRARMRMVLRVAGREGHRRLVLGALGCGAFGNPRNVVVRLWGEVLAELEFRGWWEGVVFAILEKGEGTDGDGNFGVFWRGLDGVAVG